MIPQNIFLFWKGERTELVHICLKRIREFHPHFNITVFDSSIEEIDGYDSLIVQHQSDWVRLCAIEKYGGVWLDSTCFLLKPVDEWVDMSSMQVQGFSAPWCDETLENWAFAAPRNDRLISAWKKYFKMAVENGLENFKEDAKYLLKGRKVLDHIPYLTMHACYILAVEETNMKARLEKSCAGPFKYLCVTNFDPYQAVEYLVNEKNNDIPFIKFCNHQQNVLKEKNNNKFVRFVSVFAAGDHSNLRVFIFILVLLVVLYSYINV